ncbi:aspartate--tRNA(Asn) ligase [archaeon CG06_land_8_20_14_3_00_37_11]|nr:MAG: aspartate--tRNA(Asn) ligase [archaeon CG06_land_8_20_14_3_00_37_11]
MNRTQIKDLKTGKKALILGFLQETRALSKVVFLIMRDVTGLVQCVVKDDNKFFDLVKKVNKESVLAVNGGVKANKQAMNGLEIIADNVEIINEAETPLPIPVVEKGQTTGLSKRLDWRFLDLRKENNLLIMKVSGAVEKGMRNYWEKNNFIEMHSPKLIGTASESGAEVFMLPYFGKEAFLAQSPQFYKQMAMSAGYEKVFEIGEVFRAEKSHTTRHVTEITMCDMELSFIEDHYDVMKEIEGLMVSVMKTVRDEFGKEIKNKFSINVAVPESPFPKISFKEAQDIIAKKKGKVEDESDLSSAEEELLGAWALKKHKSEFLFVVDYPWNKRPFYHMKNDDNKTTKSFDLLFKGLEITSGSQREHRANILKLQAEEKGLSLTQLQDYINFFKYGCPPHGGMGMGLARVVQKILNLDNIRDAIYLPRDPERLTP